MYLCSLRLLISVIILIISIIYVESQCVESRAACYCIRADGRGYNLTSLELESPYINEGHNITFQPCKNVDLTFNANSTNYSECKSTSVCMLNGKNQSINLGSIDESIWQVPKDDNVHLIYLHGKYVTKINLECCRSCGMSTLIIHPLSVDPHYTLVLVSPKNCLVTMRSSPLSTGSVLVILFFVFTALYFLGGALALKFFRGAVGWELLPNYDFWSDLPALVRDGVTFTLSGCSVVSYERI